MQIVSGFIAALGGALAHPLAAWVHPQCLNMTNGPICHMTYCNIFLLLLFVVSYWSYFISLSLIRDHVYSPSDKWLDCIHTIVYLVFSVIFYAWQSAILSFSSIWYSSRKIDSIRLLTLWKKAEVVLFSWWFFIFL